MITCTYCGSTGHTKTENCRNCGAGVSQWGGSPRVLATSEEVLLIAPAGIIPKVAGKPVVDQDLIDSMYRYHPKIDDIGTPKVLLDYIMFPRPREVLVPSASDHMYIGQVMGRYPSASSYTDSCGPR